LEDAAADQTAGQMLGVDHETEGLHGRVVESSNQAGSSLAECLCKCTKTSVGDVMLMCLTLGLRQLIVACSN